MELKPINKICKICFLPDMKFEVNRNQCRVCIAKKRNLCMKKLDYFNNYYANNRDKLLEQKKSYYRKKLLKNSLEISEL